MDAVTYALASSLADALIPVYENGASSPAASEIFAHSAAWAYLDNNRFFRVGGVNGADNYYEAHIWDRVSETWTAVARYPNTTIKGATGANFSDGKCLVIGGSNYPSSAYRRAQSTVYVYDAATNTYTAKAPLNQARARHGTTEISSGRVLVWGGGSWDDTTVYAPTVEIYDKSTNIWTTKASLDLQRNAPYMAVDMGDDRVLCFITGLSPDIYLYTVATNTFSLLGKPADSVEELEVMWRTRPGVALAMHRYSSSSPSGRYEYRLDRNEWIQLPWLGSPINFPSSSEKLLSYPNGDLLYCGAKTVTPIHKRHQSVLNLIDAVKAWAATR